MPHHQPSIFSTMLKAKGHTPARSLAASSAEDDPRLQQSDESGSELASSTKYCGSLGDGGKKKEEKLRILGKVENV